MASPPPPVIILGDAFVDLFCFLDGDLPKEAGGDTRLTKPITTVAGGSGLNTATHLKGIGKHSENNVDVDLYTAFNKDDAYGQLLCHHADKYGIVLRNCSSSSSGDDETSSTGHCAVLVANGERSFLTHLGVMETFKAQDINIDSVCETILRHDQSCVHVAGYFNIPGFWNGNLKQVLEDIQSRLDSKASESKNNKKMVVSLLSQYDATEQWDGQLLDLLPLVDFLFVNKLEATNIINKGAKNHPSLQQLAIQVDGDEEDFLDTIGRFFQTISPKTCIIVTLGPDGACALKGGEVIARKAAPMAVENPVDPTGAGDAFIAGFLHGIRTMDGPGNNESSSPISREAIDRGLLHGCALGTSCIMRSGASVPATKEEIDVILSKAEEKRD